MSDKTKVALSSLAVALAFASGRYSVRAPAVKTVESVNVTAVKNQDKDTRTKTVITSVKEPDGTVKTVTSIDTDTTVKAQERDKIADNLQQTVTPQKTETLNISALVSEDFSRGLPAPAYGASVSKQVLGPVRVGVFGLTSGVFGVSIGLDF